MSDNKNKNPEEVSPESILHPSDFSVDEDLEIPTPEELPETQEAPTPTGDEYTYTSRKEQKALENGKKKKDKKDSGFKARYVVIPVSAAAVLLGAFLALPFITANGKIPENVKAGTVQLGGLTIAEAEERLSNSTLSGLSDFSVTFTKNGKKTRAAFTADEIQLSIDAEKTAGKAYGLFHSPNPFKNSWNALKTVFTKTDAGAVYDYDEDALSMIFYSLGANIHGQSEEAKWEITEDTLTLTPSTPGQSHDVSLAVSEFFQSVAEGVYQEIPVTLNNNDTDLLDADRVYEEIFKEPKDAEYEIKGKKITITDHVVGIDVDKAKLSAAIDQVNKGKKVSIKVIINEPEITNEKLQASLFGATLATFSSSYATSSANRAYNVELAANKVNGIILADGAEFSYNDVVGNANAANGFKMATVYSGGKVTEGVGGGVCQVSSTLYCSVLRSDLEVTERHNHSLPISYVPGGQDATVAYGILDFKFKNNTGAPIKIVATYSSRKLTVSILGAESAKKNVEVTSQKISSVSPAVTEIPDPTLPVGQTKVISKGAYGSVYTTYKKVFDKSGALVSETKTTSRYKATPQEIAVGTMEATDIPVDPATEPTISPDGTVTGVADKKPEGDTGSETKKEEPKPSESKKEESKPSDSPAEPKPSETKTEEPKPAEIDKPIEIDEL